MSRARAKSRASSVELREYCTVKCKLSGILAGGTPSPALQTLRTEAERAHAMTKMGTFFFKAFCLRDGGVPVVDHSTVTACLQQVSTRYPRGAKGKATELATRMGTFWNEEFSKIYPERVDAVGRSHLKATVADQMMDCLLTNATTHFQSRCRRFLVSRLGMDRREASTVVTDAFRGRWDLVKDLDATETLRRVLPSEPAKGSIRYDMKKSPSRYVEATYRLCVESEKRKAAEKVKEDKLATTTTTAARVQKKQKQNRKGDRDFCFAPLRTSCVPRNIKIDTGLHASS